MQKWFFSLWLLIAGISTLTATTNSRYTEADSLKAEEILHRLSLSSPSEMGEIVKETALLFIGCPYVAATLEGEGEEMLTINLREVDCTTFVEEVLALSLTYRQGKRDFHSFLHTLQELRYREGQCNRYTDRLHYFSFWVEEGERKGLLKELRGKAFCASTSLRLHFMSSHIESYKPLLRDSVERRRMAELEERFGRRTIHYIPKERLKQKEWVSTLKEGDVIALCTPIEGLDVVHLGFAIRQKGKLHLLHASSAKGKVAIEEVPLYEYMKNRKSQTGIRVVRLNDPTLPQLHSPIEDGR